MAIYSPLWVWGRPTALLTIQTGGALLQHHVPLKPDWNSRAEPQTHNQLAVGSGWVIMPCSLLLNTLPSHLFHSQHPLRLLICCSVPRCRAASAGPEKKGFTGTKQNLVWGLWGQTIAVRRRDLELTAVFELLAFAPPDPRAEARWPRQMASVPRLHSAHSQPLEPQRHGYHGKLLQDLWCRSSNLQTYSIVLDV